ncbi:MAG: ArgE/DapE family deacylase [Candidatus Thorarchaeota archaeon]
MPEHNINETELLHLLQDLIRIESVNPTLVSGGAGEGEIAAYIGRYLERLGLEVHYQKIDSSRSNVIGILRGTGDGRTLMLNGHTDTVSIKGMDIEPLEPKYSDGRVYGRGSCDMKGSLSAMVMAAESIIKSGQKLTGDVILVFVADEEYASLGTENLIKEYTADAAIVTEPTNLDIIIAHKGFAWMQIEVYGKAAHGSQFARGVDAIVKTGKVLSAIGELEQIFASLPPHPLLQRPSIHASLIEGGVELSTYPDYCKIQLERRSLPNENKETIEAEIQAVIERIGSADQQFNARSEVFFYRPGFEISDDTPIIEYLNKACEAVISHKPKLVGASWWTDAALLTGAGIPTVLFGPIGEGGHSATEFVDFDSLVTTTRILIKTIVNFCR